MILVIFSHPYPNKSHANKFLINHISKLKNVIVSDLYEKYPDFHINVKNEQQLLLKADLIVFQFPIYWYNVPALLKQWQETVLSRGFAFGKNEHENQLSNKPCMAVLTTGHKKSSYKKGSFDNYGIENYLRPLEQMAYHCKMLYKPHLVLHQAHKSTLPDLELFARQYEQSITSVYNSIK